MQTSAQSKTVVAIPVRVACGLDNKCSECIIGIQGATNNNPYWDSGINSEGSAGRNNSKATVVRLGMRDCSREVMVERVG